LQVHSNQEKRQQRQRSDLDPGSGAKEDAGACPDCRNEQRHHGRVGIAVKAGEKDCGRRDEEERDDFAAFAELIEKKRSEAVRHDLKEPENVGEFESDSSAELIGGDHDHARERRMIQIRSILVGRPHAEAFGEVGVGHEEKGVGGPEAGGDQDEPDGERGREKRDEPSFRHRDQG